MGSGEWGVGNREKIIAIILLSVTESLRTDPLPGVNTGVADSPITISFPVPGPGSGNVRSVLTIPVSIQISSFSPLEQIYNRNLGLEDKNNNGTIDKGAGEGYEEFITKYGNADRGFFINGIVQGAGNGKLEINEIVNHYYDVIRINPNFTAETEAIDREVERYLRDNNVADVWLDVDNIVMDRVNEILGADWKRPMTFSEAERNLTG